MVEPKLALFEMQVEGFRPHSLKAYQASFCEAPESFNAIEESPTFDKFIASMIDSQVLPVTNLSPQKGLSIAIFDEPLPDGLQISVYRVVILIGQFAEIGAPKCVNALRTCFYLS